MAPSSGASSAITRPAMPFAQAEAEVVTALDAGAPELLEESGKKPAITVVANAEFAQS